MIPYELVDGVEMNRAHPDTFEIPSDAEKQAAVSLPGCYVKIGFIVEPRTERMWVCVERVNQDGTISGWLDNDPVVAVMLKHGDRITFELRHILAVHRPHWASTKH